MREEKRNTSSVNGNMAEGRPRLSASKVRNSLALLSVMFLMACGASQKKEARAPESESIGIILEYTDCRQGIQVLHAGVLNKAGKGWVNASPGRLLIELSPRGSDEVTQIEAIYDPEGPPFTPPWPNKPLQLDYSAKVDFSKDGLWDVRLTFLRDEELASSTLTIPVSTSSASEGHSTP